jgi:hypothetical protein
MFDVKWDHFPFCPLDPDMYHGSEEELRRDYPDNAWRFHHCGVPDCDGEGHECTCAGIDIGDMH